MTAQNGVALDNSYPYFTWRDATPSSVSPTITTAVKPWVPNVYNYSSNLAPVLTSTPSGVFVSNIVSVHSNAWSSTRGRSETDQAVKKAPSDMDVIGFNWFERFFELPDNKFTLRFNESATQNLLIYSSFRRDARPLSAVVLDTGPDTAMSIEPVYVFNHMPHTNLDTQFYAGKNGPALYEGTIRFDYDKQDVIWEVTLIRVSPLPWRPLKSISEKIGWYTSKINARNKSYAAGLRTAPSRTISYSMYIPKEEIHQFEALVDDAEKLVAVPLWWDERAVGELSVGGVSVTLDTTDAEFIVGEQVFIQEEGVDPKSELQGVTSTSLTDVGLLLPISNQYKHATVMPALICYIENASYDFYNQDHYFAKLTAVVATAYDMEQITYTQHYGIDVLQDPSMIQRKIHATLRRAKVTTGNKFSRKKHWNIENRLRGIYQHNFIKQGHAGRMDVKRWLATRVGGQKSFYLPTWQTDLALSSNYTGGTAMNVLGTALVPPYDIQVLLNDGSVYYSRVSDDVGSVLTLDVMPAFTIEEVAVISLMRLTRYAKDDFTMKYTNHIISELKTTAEVI